MVKRFNEVLAINHTRPLSVKDPLRLSCTQNAVLLKVANIIKIKVGNVWLVFEGIKKIIL